MLLKEQVRDSRLRRRYGSLCMRMMYSPMILLSLWVVGVLGDTASDIVRGSQHIVSGNLDAAYEIFSRVAVEVS